MPTLDNSTQGINHIESLPSSLKSTVLREIAEQYGTPVYVYSWGHISGQCASFKAHIGHQPSTICYAVKANNNVSLLRNIFSEGMGADVVSGGEFQRAQRGNCPPHKMVFSGVGKSKDEISMALEYGLLAFNVESLFELAHIEEMAQKLGKIAPVCLRINPNIDAKTNPYIATGLYETKFGLSEDSIPEALTLLKELKHVKLLGLACHIGSQITDLGPIRQALERMLGIVGELRSKGYVLEILNMGGGLGINYGNEMAPTIAQYGQMLTHALSGSSLRLVLEPGRALVGNSGVLLTRVLGSKWTPKKRFVIVDAAMTELIRPCLYDAFHHVSVVHSAVPTPEVDGLTDVVGPVCETSDFLALNRQLPLLEGGALLAIHSCGAYGASMGSSYNTRPRPPEVLVSKDSSYRLIRRRETVSEIWQAEMSDEQ